MCVFVEFVCVEQDCVIVGFVEEIDGIDVYLYVCDLYFECWLCVVKCGQCVEQLVYCQCGWCFELQYVVLCVEQYVCFFDLLEVVFEVGCEDVGFCCYGYFWFVLDEQFLVEVGFQCFYVFVDCVLCQVQFFGGQCE